MVASKLPLIQNLNLCVSSFSYKNFLYEKNKTLIHFRSDLDLEGRMKLRERENFGAQIFLVYQ